MCPAFFERKCFGTRICTILSIFCNGRDAVSFFFVLSGFVLSYKYIVLKEPLDLKKFYVSRLFRLWPAYFIALVIHCVYAYYAYKEVTIDNMVNIFVLNNDRFWEEAFLFRFTNRFYGPGWTLTIEMVASFFLPFFVILANKNLRLIPYLIFTLIIVAGQNFYSSMHFLLGILAAGYYTQINEANFKTKKWFKFRYLILAAAFFVFPIRFYDQLAPFGPTYKYLMGFMGMDEFFYTALASAVFLVTILYSKKVQRVLENKILVFIGRISFSLYLTHPLAIGIVYNYIAKILPPLSPEIAMTIMVLCYIGLLVAFSTAMHWLVEKPFIRMGKRVTSKMKPSLVIQNS